MKAAKRPRSILGRLTRSLLGLVFFAWLLAFGATFWLFNYEINEMLDEELQSVAQSTLLFLEASEAPPLPRSLGVNPEEGERLLRILRPDVPEPPAPWPALSQEGFHKTAGWRVLRLSGEGAVIEVAHSLAWRREEVLEASSALLLFVMPLLALLLWALRRSLRRGFTPLSQLSAAISGRGPSDLSPFADKDLPQELQPLAVGLNGYIARIADLRRAESRFVANASHELRTPVAALRAQLELSQAPEALAALPQIDALTRRVERLLQLSRAEAGLGLGRGPADLLQILRLLLRDAAGFTDKSLHFDDGDLESLSLPLDPDALAILLRNLIENALEHGSGRVEIRLSRACLSIKNPAKSGFRDAAFARDPASGGAGLGLNIVAELAAAMGLRLEKSFAEGVAEVVVHLPPSA